MLIMVMFICYLIVVFYYKVKMIFKKFLFSLLRVCEIYVMFFKSEVSVILYLMISILIFSLENVVCF